MYHLHDARIVLGDCQFVQGSEICCCSSMPVPKTLITVYFFFQVVDGPYILTVPHRNSFNISTNQHPTNQQPDRASKPAPPTYCSTVPRSFLRFEMLCLIIPTVCIGTCTSRSLMTQSLTYSLNRNPNTKMVYVRHFQAIFQLCASLRACTLHIADACKGLNN